MIRLASSQRKNSLKTRARDDKYSYFKMFLFELYLDDESSLIAKEKPIKTRFRDEINIHASPISFSNGVIIIAILWSL